MSNEKKFVDGLIVKEGKYGTKLSFKVEEFTNCMNANSDNGWFNVEVKTSKGGKLYAQIDTWKPSEKPNGIANNTNFDNQKDDLPF